MLSRLDPDTQSGKYLISLVCMVERLNRTIPFRKTILLCLSLYEREEVSSLSPALRSPTTISAGFSKTHSESFMRRAHFILKKTETSQLLRDLVAQYTRLRILLI
jgi:hypothetical protein